ncbi:MAG: hypothetical protein QM621_06305 [Aeromicrobium sp.]|uniref:hypothetical protein n=1 Tax=Aeromicrobium sp. TaxID=1871063 RepID=UPI0039E627F4
MADDETVLRRMLSPARMSPYLVATGGTWDKAVELYDWNVRASSAFFESIHYLEIGLRNSLDGAAAACLGPMWLTSGTALTARSRDVVRIAVRQAGGPQVPRGKVVAELPFGFWWSLLADEYNRRLWQPALRHAFTGPVRRRRLHAELDEVRRLRNRIAHHEPIHTRDLDADFRRLVDISGRLGSALARHITQTTRVAAVLRERP